MLCPAQKYFPPVRRPAKVVKSEGRMKAALHLPASDSLNFLPHCTLFNFDRPAYFFDLLLDVLGFSLGNGFFDRLRHTLNQILRFF